MSVTAHPGIDALLPRLEGSLRADGSVPSDDLDRAAAVAAIAGSRLDEVLIELGIVTEARVQKVLEAEFGVTECSPEELPAEPLLIDRLAPGYLAANGLLPLAWSGRELVIAMRAPFDDFQAQALALKLRCRVVRRRIGRSGFEELFSLVYGEGWFEVADPERVVASGPGAIDDLELLRDAASDAPVVRFVQQMLRAAVESGASDIHLRPRPHRAEMSFRINGSLVPQTPPDIGALPGIISRLKILAGLDISERRLPQDGKIRTAVAGSQLDIRVSTMPQAHGEGMVLRLLGGEAAASSLGELGFSPGIQAVLETLFGDGQGLVLVTGPTGSGKSTTLHAGLKRLIRPDLNIVTVEDPIEYRLEGAVQIQVDDRIGLTFPHVLRSLLRQDPDVILIGEIRDPETARIAVQAALTGHLVLATLHTNSALAAVPRLIDMGVEPYLLSAVLRGILAQRLVRRLCQACGGGSQANGSPGCEGCHGTGYAGRIAVGELALCDAETAGALAIGHALPDHLLARLAARGYRPLGEDVAARVAAGEVAPGDVRALLHD